MKTVPSGAEAAPDEMRYLRTDEVIDHGKYGVTRVRVYDPCITEQAREKRRAAIVETCRELIRRGQM